MKVTELLEGLDDRPYYSNYGKFRTSRSAIASFRREIAETFGMPESKISITPYLLDNKPSFRFKFKIRLNQKDDPALTSALLFNFAKKDLENDYPEVTSYSDPAVWKSGNATHILFSLKAVGKQK